MSKRERHADKTRKICDKQGFHYWGMLLSEEQINSHAKERNSNENNTYSIYTRNPFVDGDFTVVAKCRICKQRKFMFQWIAEKTKGKNNGKV